MRILLTGGTGYIGSAVLDRLRERGHDVLAIARSDDSAAALRARGVEAAVGDQTDVAWLSEQLSTADAAIHLANGGPEVDDPMIEAAGRTLAGKPFLYTGGVWIWGTSDAITEQAPLDPPAITSWRPERETRVLQSATAAVIHPGVVYGGDTGIVQMTVVDAPRDDDGAVRLVGPGTQHWATVHVDDLAELYVLALESGATGRILGVSGANPSVRELALAAHGDDAALAPQTVEATQAWLSAPFADALLLDQQADGAHARSLGWTPSRPSAVELLRAGR